MATQDRTQKHPAKKPEQAAQPDALPKTGYVRISTILKFIPVCSATIWRGVKRGTFPKPVKLGDRITAWKAEDVHAWLAEQAKG